jgi:hypothetical protein
VAYASGFTEEATTLFANMTTAPTLSRAIIINDFIRNLKSSGIWPLLDVLYVTAAATSQAALLNWKAPAGSFNALAVNAPTFVADRGYTGNGTSGRLNTQWTPSTNGVNFTQNSASAWVYCLTNVSEAAADIGGTTSSFCRVISRNGANMGVSINDGTASTAALGTATSVGFSGVSRAASGTLKAWKNGVQQGADISVNSVSVNGDVQWICGGDSTDFSTKQIGCATWGGALTGKEAQLYNLVFTYLQTIGAQ